jgi:K+-sensing histidine kinase KdpD
MACNCEIAVSDSRSRCGFSMHTSMRAGKMRIQLTIFPTATLPFVILRFREDFPEIGIRMQLSHWINTDLIKKHWVPRNWVNKKSIKSTAGKLWIMPLMDAAIGALVCSLAALGAIAAAEGHSWKNMVPLVFAAILVVIAALFGAKAGILSTVLAALFFATFLFGPTGNIAVANESARSNLGWMLLIGIGFSFLFAPTSSGFRRH